MSNEQFCNCYSSAVFNSTYTGFPKGYCLTTKPRLDVQRTYCVNARLGGKHNRLRENLHKCYYIPITKHYEKNVHCNYAANRLTAKLVLEIKRLG